MGRKRKEPEREKDNILRERDRISEPPVNEEAGSEKSVGLTKDMEEEEEATGKQKREKHEYNATTEQRLVDFYAANDCFYNKASVKHQNGKYKNRLLDNLAKEINTTANKITKWFAGQRTTVGKLLQKPKSGSKAKALTARQRWQLRNFHFLKDHIIPRIHTHDKGALPLCEDEGNGDDGEVASTSEGQCGQPFKRTKLSPKLTGSNMQDTFLQFLQTPPASVSRAKTIQELDPGQLDDKRAFGQWFCTKMLKIPDERWDSFEDEAHALLAKYTRQQLVISHVQHIPSQPQQSPSPWPQQQQQSPTQQSQCLQSSQPQMCMQQWSVFQPPQAQEQRHPPRSCSAPVMKAPRPQPLPPCNHAALDKGLQTGISYEPIMHTSNCDLNVKLFIPKVEN